MKKKVELIGRKFGKLVVVGFHSRIKYRNYWECLCSCGGLVVVREDHLLSNHTRSCGCMKKSNQFKSKKV